MGKKKNSAIIIDQDFQHYNIRYIFRKKWAGYRILIWFAWRIQPHIFGGINRYSDIIPKIDFLLGGIIMGMGFNG